ncbi:sugar ABC transporter permease [Alicyclobacillus fastidiosus]|uniref:Sugar ABC transporter permease n=1 Tax=Alicyclobacillus fastidiosus TaxID=392011 RepID=A0ABY6ZAA6_9BACL|nr:sugar ABC transporter permease [Alicyclobacillus fastidiosus]WAH39759.1 sugar ABC transporter permease [Alicyclobacillus fastidiosus]
MTPTGIQTQYPPIRRKSKKQNLSPTTRSQRNAGIVLGLPWFIGLILFFLIPFFISLYWSFTNYSILKPGTFVGLSNYVHLFHDATFLKSLLVTFYYTVFSVPLTIIVGVGVSLLLNLKVKGQAIFRTAAFVPSLVPVIAIMILWNWLLSPQIGVVNWLLSLIHVQGPGWFTDQHWAMPAMVLVSLWTGIGGSTVIYLAGLQDVPQDLYDSAEVDGAGVFRRARHVTIPLLTPVIFFQLIMGIIGALQQFNLPYLISGGNGNPNNSLLFYGIYQYQTAFSYLRMGYASAMAWVMFIIILIITAFVFKSQSRWVFYQGAKER